MGLVINYRELFFFCFFFGGGGGVARKREKGGGGQFKFYPYKKGGQKF